MRRPERVRIRAARQVGSIPASAAYGEAQFPVMKSESLKWGPTSSYTSSEVDPLGVRVRQYSVHTDERRPDLRCGDVILKTGLHDALRSPRWGKVNPTAWRLVQLQLRARGPDCSTALN